MLKTLLVAASSATLALPIAASAQSWGGDYSGGQWGYGYRQAFAGYPQFRDEKAHIRAEIREGLNDGWLDRDQAGDLYRQLQWVQRREAREFGAHGWSLPPWDQQQIRSSLDQIDKQVDQARDSGGEY
jgi:opacity protein-like surface antigen